MTGPYWLATAIVLASAALCILLTTVVGLIALVADMIRVVNLADARRPAELLWREGLAEHTRSLPRDPLGRFARSMR